MRFPAEDGGLSLAETASSDFDAALQLLAERAKYITGAQAATISLLQEGELICRACVGAPKQKTDASTTVGSGLAAECARTRRILRCDDTSKDPRVNSEICRKYGIGSAMLMPLIRGQEVIGVFELLSGSVNGFEERDLTAMQRLGEMIETAVEHSDAAQQVAGDYEEGVLEEEARNIVEIPEVMEAESEEVADEVSAPEPSQPPEPSATDDGRFVERGSISNCQSCGFPVSGQRTLCVDCDKGNTGFRPGNASAPAFLAGSHDAEPIQPSWLRSHGYTIATFLLLAATVALVVWMRFGPPGFNPFLK